MNKSYLNLKSSENETEPFVEVDPTGRYGRYQELLGLGSTKKVYRAFDQEDGKEVAWNQVLLRKFIDNEDMMKRIYLEVQLLKLVCNENIITSFHEWIDREHWTLNFITEICVSGNLRDYRKKHINVSLKAVKKWLKQILMALEYLHTYEPCIIHGDLNCSNVFINGNTGEVKVGDLGTSTVIVEDSHVVHTVAGTPEYMAPEVYEENYTEAADIYAFGMCTLELVTKEIPYSECDTVVQIYKKVVSGLKPRAMNKVKDPEVKRFIEKCLAKQSERPSATELLKDRFFHGLDENIDTSSESTMTKQYILDLYNVIKHSHK